MIFCRNVIILPVAFYMHIVTSNISVVLLKSQSMCACECIWSIIIRGNSCMDLCGLKGAGFADNLWLLRQEAWREPQEVALRTDTQNRACMCSSGENKHSFQVHKHNDLSVCISAFPCSLQHGTVHMLKKVHPASMCAGNMTKQGHNNMVCF